MTVCVAVKVYDCIVFAADSASSLVVNDPVTGRAEIANVYVHGVKVFNLRKGLPIAAMTCGMGNIGAMSIGTLAKELREKFRSEEADWKLDPDQYTMQEVAEKARRFFFDVHYQHLADKPLGDHELQFWVRGNGSAETHGEIWRVTIRNGTKGISLSRTVTSDALIIGMPPPDYDFEIMYFTKSTQRLL